MDKKGISTVVVTVLIVLVAIIAVAILWAALRPPIEKGAAGAGKAQECFYLNLQIASANATTDTVKVKRDAGTADLTKMKIIVNGVITESSTVPAELETKSYTVTLASGDEVEIAGVLAGDVTCSVADTVTVA